MSEPGAIPVYRGGRVVAYAAVDPSHAPLLTRYHWHLHAKGYAYRTTRRRGGLRLCFYLHREAYRLANPDAAVPPSVDHLNGCKLDCRACNLEGVALDENTRRARRPEDRRYHAGAPAFVGRVLTDDDLPPF